MRLFGYYALHTFKNQLKKLFKTWVLVFILVCALMGGVIGFLAASATDDGPDDMDAPPEATDTLPDAGLPAGEDAAAIAEAAAGAVVLAIFAFMAMGADKNGSRIFLPADVNVLFPSPMRPQSVLLFRLTTQLGVSLLAGFYLLIQLPNLVGNLGLSLWSGLIIVAAFCLTVLTGTLLRVLLYILAATYPRVKRGLRPGLYAVLALVAAGYLIALRGGRGYLWTAADYFGGHMSRLIPFWGWLKAACGCAAAGQMGTSAIYLAATVLGGAALVWVIWHIRADFYEDAMAKSEETAELLARAQSEKGAGVVVRRKKDRSDRLRRDGMHHGAGANVYFFKAMYNRFRFAHLGLFTKTLETYLLAGLAVGLLSHQAWAVAGALGVMTFFRAMGNPLEQDAGMDGFLLVPESTFSKLMWSMLGVLTNCLLDLLPALLVGSLAAGGGLFGAVKWLPVILSVHFYAIAVGAFIGFSVPVNAGKTVKQLVQVLFVYFGLLPDLAIFLLSGSLLTAAALSTAVNAGLGLLFFALIPRFLDPRPRPAVLAGSYTVPAGGYTVPAGYSPVPAAASPMPDISSPLPPPGAAAAGRRRGDRGGAGAAPGRHIQPGRVAYHLPAPVRRGDPRGPAPVAEDARGGPGKDLPPPGTSRLLPAHRHVFDVRREPGGQPYHGSAAGAAGRGEPQPHPGLRHGREPVDKGAGDGGGRAADRGVRVPQTVHRPGAHLRGEAGGGAVGGGVRAVPRQSGAAVLRLRRGAAVRVYIRPHRPAAVQHGAAHVHQSAGQRGGPSHPGGCRPRRHGPGPGRIQLLHDCPGGGGPGDPVHPGKACALLPGGAGASRGQPLQNCLPQPGHDRLRAAVPGLHRVYHGGVKRPPHTKKPLRKAAAFVMLVCGFIAP